jgi:hypothetical protein
MGKVIGVIAEDYSDVAVLKELIKKISLRRPFKVNRFVGNGCGKIKGKCHQWAHTLNRQGCESLILLQDLDTSIVGRLTQELEDALRPCPISNYIVVIPVREIESWLLCDPYAIKQALNLQFLPKEVSNPEAILNPKTKMRDIVRVASKKTIWYLNTAHNHRIAAEARLEKLRKCQSFRPLEQFLIRVF